MKNDGDGNGNGNNGRRRGFEEEQEAAEAAAEAAEAAEALLYDRVNILVSRTDLARILISLEGYARGGEGGSRSSSDGGSDSFFTTAPSPDAANGDDNSTIDEGGWRRRASRISALLLSEATGLWVVTSSKHKNAVDDRDDGEYAAWEPT